MGRAGVGNVQDHPTQDGITYYKPRPDSDNPGLGRRSDLSCSSLI